MLDSNPFSTLDPILPSEQLIESVFKKSMKAMGSGGSKGVMHVTLVRRLESRRVETCAKLFKEKLENIIKQFPNLDELNPFYSEMIELLIGKDHLRRVLGSLQGSISQLWSILREHKAKIWSADAKQAKKERKAAFSRFSSIIQQLSDRFILLTDLVYKLKKLPSIDYSDPRIVVAGYPNVGKSSFLINITNAKPEIANYPFTSKEVSIGHFKGVDRFHFLNCQVIDTPGLLDRPIGSRNDIEKRAIAALKTLPSLILFLIDLSSENLVENQLNLYSEIRSAFEKVPIVVIINKVDLIEPEFLKNRIRFISDKIGVNPYSQISAIDQNQCRKLMENLISDFLF